MLKDRMVRVKLKRNYSGHRPMSYVGKVTSFPEGWVVVDARGVMVSRHEKDGVQIDEKSSAMVIPKENIESIRVLPDDFDVGNIRVTTAGQQLLMVVDRALDAYLGEMGEG